MIEPMKASVDADFIGVITDYTLNDVRTVYDFYIHIDTDDPKCGTGSICYYVYSIDNGRVVSDVSEDVPKNWIIA